MIQKTHAQARAHAYVIIGTPHLSSYGYTLEQL
jgi:hypothetical protein